jgi:hypothetical protein
MVSINPIFHIGTPRTGTTSLQHHLHSNQDLLHDLGYRYSSQVVSDQHPQHAQLVWALYEGSLKFCDRFVDRARQEAGDRTLLLSTEALYHMWPRLPANAKRWVSRTAAQESWQAVIVIRDKEDFVRSMYDHCRSHPPVPVAPEMGTRLSYREFSRLPHIRQVSDYPGMLIALNVAFNHNVVVMPYTDNVVGTFYRDVLGHRDDVHEYRLNSQVA